jgi:hypothetical protein
LTAERAWADGPNHAKMGGGGRNQIVLLY